MREPNDDTERKRLKFERARTLAIPDEWNRLLWARDKEIEIKGDRRIGIDYGTAHFYRESVRSLYLGCPLGAILLAAAACERELRNVTQSTEDPQFCELIEKAKDTGKISDGMADRLHRLRKRIRNPVAHADEDVIMGFLGMERTSRYTWVVPEGKKQLTTFEAAQEAVETFLGLLSNLFDRESAERPGSDGTLGSPR